MDVIAWSQNLTPEKADPFGATAVSKRELFAGADILSIHTVLSERTRGVVDAGAIAAMRPTAWLVNTSRGPVVDEAALLDALRARRIAGLAVDVFDTEPLPADTTLFRTLPNVLATPHIGYVTESLYRTFYGATASPTSPGGSMAAGLPDIAGRRGTAWTPAATRS